MMATKSNTGGGKPKKTPEQKAARKEKREARIAAMSPDERKAHEAKRAERKAAKDDA